MGESIAKFAVEGPAMRSVRSRQGNDTIQKYVRYEQAFKQDVAIIGHDISYAQRVTVRDFYCISNYLV